MNTITVVDARMGRGKSSAAIRYMNQYKGTKRFLYITPFLDEVDRICEQCDFDQPDNELRSKSTELKMYMAQGKNIAATHVLFSLMDDETLALIKSRHYSLIVDESIQVIEKLNISAGDFKMLLNQCIEEEDGLLRWRDNDYSGVFHGYKKLADAGSLYRLDSALLNVMNPDMFRAFDEVIMMTYLFNGQYQRAYLDYFGFEYRIVGIEQDDSGFFFSGKPDNPPPIDYEQLIKIVDNRNLNKVGDSRCALSKSWFTQRGYEDPDIKALRNGLRTYFYRTLHSDSDTRLWTSFKEAQTKLVDKKHGRFKNDFLQISARATNEYRNRTDIAYLANRFIDPNQKKFFARKGITINADEFALAEMLQWIWRSAIRDDKPINLYIPSMRMRRLLNLWIFSASEGGSPNAE